MVGSMAIASSIVTFEQGVHFFTPNGDDVVIGPGAFEVEAAEEWLRFIPQGGDRADAVLVQAEPREHRESVTTPIVLSHTVGEDQHLVALLLPDGTMLETEGSYSGVRSRGRLDRSRRLKRSPFTKKPRMSAVGKPRRPRVSKKPLRRQPATQQVVPSSSQSNADLLGLLPGSQPSVPVSPAPTESRTLRVALGSTGDCLSQPCGSIQSALGTARPGDMVMVSAGTYREATIPLTEGVHVRGEGAILEWTQGAVVVAQDINGAILEGFVIKGGEMGAIHVVRSNVSILRNVIIDNINRGFAPPVGGILIDGTHEAEGSVLIANNRFSNNHGAGRDDRNDVGGAILIQNFSGLAKIINNTFYANGTRNGAGGAAIYNRSGNTVLIQNNIFSHNGIVGSQTVTILAQGNTVLHNNGFFMDGILLQNPQLGFTARTVNDLNNAASVQADNNIQGDPEFVAAAQGNFHLSATSLARDRGLAINAPPTDFDGNARPVGSAFDIGMFEFTSGSSTASNFSPPIRQQPTQQSSSSGIQPGAAQAGPGQSGRTLRVIPGARGDCLSQPCGSIGMALRGVQAGDTVAVSGGTYTENIQIESSVTLRVEVGMNRPVSTPPPSPAPSPGSGESGSAVRTVNPGGVIITEIMARPGSVSDTAGEWFEIYNTLTNTAVDINEWTIRDRAALDTHIINYGRPLIIPPGSFFVLGRNRNKATNGGVSVAYQYNNFRLSNNKDEIFLVDVNGNTVDSVSYGFTSLAGVSSALDPSRFDGIANDLPANWCNSTVAFGPGGFGTPGNINHPCPR